LIATLLLAGAIVVYATGIRGEYEEVLRLRGEQIGGETFLSTQTEMKGKLDALIGSATGAANANLREAVSRTLPFGEEMPNAVAQFNGIALESGISILSMSATANPAAPRTALRGLAPVQNIVRPLETISFELKLSGPYENFKRFLKGLEENVRMFQVKAFSITPAGKPEQDFYTYAVSVATYYQTIPLLP